MIFQVIMKKPSIFLSQKVIQIFKTLITNQIFLLFLNRIATAVITGNRVVVKEKKMKVIMKILAFKEMVKI